MPVPEEVEFRALAKFKEQIEAAAEEIAGLSDDQAALFSGLNVLKVLINEVYDVLDERISNLENGPAKY